MQAFKGAESLESRHILLFTHILTETVSQYKSKSEMKWSLFAIFPSFCKKSAKQAPRSSDLGACFSFLPRRFPHASGSTFRFKLW